MRQHKRAQACVIHHNNAVLIDFTPRNFHESSWRSRSWYAISMTKIKCDLPAAPPRRLVFLIDLANARNPSHMSHSAAARRPKFTKAYHSAATPHPKFTKTYESSATPRPKFTKACRPAATPRPKFANAYYSAATPRQFASSAARCSLFAVRCSRPARRCCSGHPSLATSARDLWSPE